MPNYAQVRLGEVSQLFTVYHIAGGGGRQAGETTCSLHGLYCTAAGQISVQVDTSCIKESISWPNICTAGYQLYKGKNYLAKYLSSWIPVV